MRDPIERLRALLDNSATQRYGRYVVRKDPHSQRAAPAFRIFDHVDEPIPYDYHICGDMSLHMARAIAAWMNLRGEVMALVEAVQESIRRVGSCSRYANLPGNPWAFKGCEIYHSDDEREFCSTCNLESALAALRAAIEREVGDE